jgi:hypothetical protein
MLNSELKSLQNRREELCGDFLAGKCAIPELCLTLDSIGNRFERNCILSQCYEQGKFSSTPNLRHLI